MNIFEQATRNQTRFTSIKGLLTVEDLWQLPLQSKTGFDLDSVAKEANRQLKEVTEESFVSTTTNPSKAVNELRLEVVKHIIAVKMAENEAKRTAADKVAKREKILGILASKEEDALKGMTREELLKQLNEL